MLSSTIAEATKEEKDNISVSEITATNNKKIDE